MPTVSRASVFSPDAHDATTSARSQPRVGDRRTRTPPQRHARSAACGIRRSACSLRRPSTVTVCASSPLNGAAISWYVAGPHPLRTLTAVGHESGSCMEQRDLSRRTGQDLRVSRALRSHSADTHVVALEGVVDAASVDGVVAAVVAARSSVTVLLDVSQVSAYAPGSFGALVAAARTLASRGSHLVLVDPTARLYGLARKSGTALVTFGEADDGESRGGDISLTFADALIREVFAVGLSVAGARSALGTDGARHGLDDAIQRLDAIVREIRGAMVRRRPCA